jgi:hypothetical protein
MIHPLRLVLVVWLGGAASLSAQAAPAAPWSVGTRVVTTGTVFVRADSLSNASAPVDSLRSPGDRGRIIGGPFLPPGDLYSVRWKVDYAVGRDGWSSQILLARDTAPLPPPVSVPTRIAVAPLAVILTLGIPGSPPITTATVTVWDAAGVVLSRSATWTSSNPAVATVDTGGIITARAVGVDTVRAHAGTLVSAGIRVTVIPYVPPPPVCTTSPPPVGCGMRAPLWALLGVGTVARTYGPWFILDTLGYKRQAVRVVVTDTAP